MIKLTDEAAIEIRKLQKEHGAEGVPLRLFIAKGGCSGFEYGMRFDEPQEGDVRSTSMGVELVVDPHSAQHLKEIEIDFNDGLHGKGFEFKNPHASNTCGCGKSFS